MASRNIVFHPQGWEDFIYWATADKKMLRRLLRLIEEAGRTRSKAQANPNRSAAICLVSGRGESTMSTG